MAARTNRIAFAIVAILIAACSPLSFAQSTNNDLPLGAPSPSASVEPAPGTAESSALPSWARTAGSLALVLILISGFAFAMKKGSNLTGNNLRHQLGSSGRAPSGVVFALGRYPIARGHSIVLLKVDRRVLVLDQTANGFRTLSEFNDAEDVASILLKTRDEEGETLSKQFNDLLSEFESDPSLVAEETAGPTSPRMAMANIDNENDHARASAELESQLNRLRGASAQGGIVA
ncbi:MAG: flagellar biosynthetic protein FliO [Planctomycetota bacterium]